MKVTTKLREEFLKATRYAAYYAGGKRHTIAPTTFDNLDEYRVDIMRKCEKNGIRVLDVKVHEMKPIDKPVKKVTKKDAE